jgi:hypothetical protein
MLRGRRSKDPPTSNTACLRLIHEDGTIAYSLSHRFGNDDATVYPEWLLGIVANALWAMNGIQNALRTPELAYGLHFELTIDGNEPPLYGGWRFSAAKLPTGELILPRLECRGIEEFDGIISMVYRDLWNCAGIDVSSSIKISWDIS